MKKVIEITTEALDRLDNGLCVEGSLRKDQQTGRIVFRPYNRLSRRRKDRLVRPLEHGWLKESPTRLKFFNSVKKELGYRLVNVAMHRELKEAMEAVEIEELLRD